MAIRTDMWTFREGIATQNLTGFDIEARDGKIGKVDEATNEVGGSFLVVDTGPWIFGKKVLLPAGVIRDVDLDAQTVFVNRTKDEIKNAPEFDDSNLEDENYRNQLGTYYGSGATRTPDDELV